MIADLATFAERFKVSAANAYVLPALFERSAKLVNMPVQAFISEATYCNPKLGAYLADAARKVAEMDRGAVALHEAAED